MRAPSLKSSDFQRALGTRPVARTAHFFLYALPRLSVSDQAHLRRAEKSPHQPSTAPLAVELSTGEDPVCPSDVDDLGAVGPCRFGLVLPKKQARRSVTRSLIRHQAREAVRRHAPALASQDRFGRSLDAWVLRLRAPFDRQLFPSAASPALSAAVRLELDELWGRLAKDSVRAQA
ncbi:MAG: ribonuclease P protein component [Aquabacterium commune]|uniref:ribonuclease P protein component n=1 Tax=Aquabacterium TaxID=92793 RepID=UPI0025BE3EDA|nr:ribonuclease P protein component [Aquabacterium sp.]